MATQRLRSRTPAAAPEPPRAHLRITAFGSKEKRADTSRQIFQENEFGATSVAALRLTPLAVPYDPLNLATIVERSNMLKQCIEAKVTNVGKNGFEVAPVSDKEKADPGEEEELQSFIDFANSEESLTTVHAGIVDDYETYGYAYMEVIRDKSRRISIVRRVPSQTCRVLPKDKQKIKVMYDVLRGKRTAYVTEYRTFRGYVQIVDGKSVFFKEFGDPRKMNSETGRYEDVTLDNEATEIIHFRQKSLDAYGVPRWITQLPSILGSRESEEVNLRYFEDNTVPPMILSVSGGRLTGSSFRELERAITKQSIGKDRQHKILLLEAVPEREGLDEKGATVQLKVDKLTDARQSDGLFSEYDKSNQDKIRSSFRLPPAVVGLSQDITFACYDNETETLTDQGWVKLDDWQNGLKVMCYDYLTEELSAHEPLTGLLVYEVKDVQMYDIQTEQVDISVTPNHRMLCSYKNNGDYDIETIERMHDRNRVYFKATGEYVDGNECLSFAVPDSNYKGGIAALDADVGDVSMDLVLKWIGYYIADGCIAQNGNAVRIGAKKERKILQFEDLHESLQDAGFRVRARQEMVGTYYTVSHKGFVSWLAENAGDRSENKRIPAFVWSLPARQLRVLFDALMACDGTWDSREGRTSGAYSTVSAQLADDVQRLAFLLGYRTLLRSDPPGSFSSRDTYRVLLSTKTVTTIYPRQHITRRSYTGKVYCFSVPTGVFVTRRNGKVAIQGNTANVSAFIAETQVFGPDRQDFDEAYNKKLVQSELGLGLRTVKLVSKAPPITNQETIIKSLTALNVMGALTPRMAISAANKIMQHKLPQYPEKNTEDWEEWMDRPIIFVTRGTASQDGQNQKDGGIKETEEDGEVVLDQPEHGQE